MVREDILGGLKAALARGQSMSQAMMSFYNSGYTKKEIEEAAKVLQMETFQRPQVSSGRVISNMKDDVITKSSGLKKIFGEKKILIKPKVKVNEKKPIAKTSGVKKPIMKVPAMKMQTNKKPIQKVSSYGQKKVKPTGKFMVIFLIFLLLFFLGGLASIFLFKEEILRFINNLI